MASDTAGKLGVINDVFIKSEEYYNEKYDYLIDLNTTAPLRESQNIINSFHQFIENN